MIELEKSQYPRILPLTQDVSHNRALIYSILEGNHPGQVLCGNIGTPGFALLLTKVGYCFVIGCPDGNDCQMIADYLFEQVLSNGQEKEMILFSFSEHVRSMLDKAFSGRDVKRLVRHQFRFSMLAFEASVAALKLSDETPTGQPIRDMTTQDAEILGIPSFLCDFPKNGFGSCIRSGPGPDAVIASHCYPVFLGGGDAEVDVATAEAYRGQGLATRTAIAFIRQCMLRGFTPNWACWPYRKESRILALNLGFEQMEDIPAHYWSKS